MSAPVITPLYEEVDMARAKDLLTFGLPVCAFSSIELAGKGLRDNVLERPPRSFDITWAQLLCGRHPRQVMPGAEQHQRFFVYLGDDPVQP